MGRREGGRAWPLRASCRAGSGGAADRQPPAPRGAGTPAQQPGPPREEWAVSTSDSITAGPGVPASPRGLWLGEGDEGQGPCRVLQPTGQPQGAGVSPPDPPDPFPGEETCFPSPVVAGEPPVGRWGADFGLDLQTDMLTGADDHSASCPQRPSGATSPNGRRLSTIYQGSRGQLRAWPRPLAHRLDGRGRRASGHPGSALSTAGPSVPRQLWNSPPQAQTRPV